MKRSLLSSLTLAGVVLASSVLNTAQAASGFVDVPDDSPYASYVQELKDRNIISGIGNGLFAPEKTLSRAEMATFLVRAFGISQNAGPSVSFTDIRGHWSESYIKAAYAAEMIAGKSATTFAPDAPVTREEAAQMVWNYLSKQGISTQTVAVSGKADAWAQTAVANVLGRKLYGPTAYSDWTVAMNRQEAAALIDLAMQALSQKSQPASVPPVSSESSGSSGMLPASADNLKTNSDGTLSPTNVTIPAPYANDPIFKIASQDEIKNLMAQVKFKVDGSSVTVTLPDTNDSRVQWNVVARLAGHKLSDPYRSTKGTSVTFENTDAVGVTLDQPYNVGSGVYLSATFKNTNGQWTLQYS